MALSESMAKGDWRLYFLLRDRVRDISLAEVQRVAEQYLVGSNRTLGIVSAGRAPERAPAPQRVDIAATDARTSSRRRAAATGRGLRRHAGQSRCAHAALHGRRHESGACCPRARAATRCGRVLTLRFGDERSLFGQGGVRRCVAGCSTRAAPRMTRQQMQDRLDPLKTEMSISGGRASVNVSLSDAARAAARGDRAGG